MRLLKIISEIKKLNPKNDIPDWEEANILQNKLKPYFRDIQRSYMDFAREIGLDDKKATNFKIGDVNIYFLLGSDGRGFPIVTGIQMEMTKYNTRYHYKFTDEDINKMIRDLKLYFSEIN